MDNRTQDQRLRDFALSLIAYMQADVGWWETEIHWDISELGLEHQIFHERLPTQQELEDGSVVWCEGDPPIRFLQPWVISYLTDLKTSPMAKNPMEVML